MKKFELSDFYNSIYTVLIRIAVTDPNLAPLLSYSEIE